VTVLQSANSIIAEVGPGEHPMRLFATELLFLVGKKGEVTGGRAPADLQRLCR
jgi:hypothetical protein